MALLSLANHSILSYGSFGTWGALLAGGEIVIPESHLEEGSIKFIIEANLTNVTIL
jgi:hypothetical protein